MPRFLALIFSVFLLQEMICQDTIPQKDLIKNADLKPYWETMMSLPRSEGRDNKDRLFLDQINNHPDGATKEKLLLKYKASQKHKKLYHWIFYIGPAVSFVPVIGTAPFVTGMQGPDFGIPTQQGFEYALIGISAGALIRIGSFAAAIVNRNKRRSEELEMELIWNNYIKTKK